MSSPKLQPIEIITRREKLNLSVKEICRIFKLDEATWKRWETTATAPYFFGFALRWLEENINETRPQKREKKGHSSSRSKTLSFRGKFLAKTRRDEASGCLIWTGANSIRLEGGGFASPRQAAWIIKHGVKPGGEIKLTCQTEKCVEDSHFTLAPTRSSGRKTISDDLKNIVRFELKNGGGVKALAKQFHLSVGTVSRLKNEIGKNNPP